MQLNKQKDANGLLFARRQLATECVFHLASKLREYCKWTKSSGLASGSAAPC